MSQQGHSKNSQDPLDQYRKRLEEEREKRFHSAAEVEDPYGWRKRPSSEESRKKKRVRKLGTSGKIISNSATTGDDRTKYRTRNGVTWRTVKTEEELQKEAEEAAEREALRKKRSQAHKHDRGRPAYTRYVIKLNVVGYPKPYYYCGDELGWGNYEWAMQYLGKKNTLSFAKRMIKAMGLEDKTDRFDSIEVVSIPPELNKEWLYAENIKGKYGESYEEETYETHEEFVENKRRQNESRPDKCCETCLCNDCNMRDPLNRYYCDKCRKCRAEGDYQNWKDECEWYVSVANRKGPVHLM